MKDSFYLSRRYPPGIPAYGPLEPEKGAVDFAPVLGILLYT